MVMMMMTTQERGRLWDRGIYSVAHKFRILHIVTGTKTTYPCLTEARNHHDHTTIAMQQKDKNVIVRHHVEYSACAFLTGGTEDGRRTTCSELSRGGSEGGEILYLIYVT